MKASKCKVKFPRESFQIHFPHFHFVWLSKLSVFSLTIQETDASSFRPWFAGHTNLWANLSHWICLLHRSSFQDKPWLETAKKNPYKPDNISSSRQSTATCSPSWHIYQWSHPKTTNHNTNRLWRQWHTSKITIYGIKLFLYFHKSKEIRQVSPLYLSTCTCAFLHGGKSNETIPKFLQTLK